MPIYEFRCKKCGTTLEALRRMGQGAEGLKCPDCGSKALAPLLSTFATTSGQEPSCSASAGCTAGSDRGGGCLGGSCGF